MYEKQVMRKYHVELWVAIAIYAVLLTGSIRYARPLPDSPLRTGLLLLPMLGFALVIRAIVSMFAIWPVMCASWGVANLVRKWTER